MRIHLLQANCGLELLYFIWDGVRIQFEFDFTKFEKRTSDFFQIGIFWEKKNTNLSERKIINSTYTASAVTIYHSGLINSSNSVFLGVN